MARVYESRTNRALVHNYFIARKYNVLSRYVANNYINVFPANTFFNDVGTLLTTISTFSPLIHFSMTHTRLYQIYSS